MNKKILYSEVIYLKAEANYTIFYFEDGGKYISGYNLKFHQEKNELNGFYRVNRSYLLNPKYISTIVKEGNSTSIRMSNGTKTKVPRRKTLEINLAHS